jgi:hypothetical protein
MLYASYSVRISNCYKSPLCEAFLDNLTELPQKPVWCVPTIATASAATLTCGISWRNANTTRVDAPRQDVRRKQVRAIRALDDRPIC